MGETSFEDLVCAYLSDMDLVLADGFLDADAPKIEVVCSSSLLGGMDELLAIVTDTASFDVPRPQFALDEASDVAEFLVKGVVHPQGGRRCRCGWTAAA